MKLNQKYIYRFLAKECANAKSNAHKLCFECDAAQSIIIEQPIVVTRKKKKERVKVGSLPEHQVKILVWPEEQELVFMICLYIF